METLQAPTTGTDTLLSPTVGPALVYATIVLGVAVLIKTLTSSRVPANIPPFPVKAFPILGHLFYLREDRRKTMLDWAKSAGEMYSLYFGSRLVIMLNSYETAHLAFVKHADVMTDRPPNVNSNATSKNTGILSSSGQVWKEQRTISLQILRSFGMGKNLLALKVTEEAHAYLEELVKLSGKPTDARNLTNTAVSNVICSIIVGRRFEFNDAYFLKFLDILNEQVHLSSNTSMFTNFRWLRHLPGDLFGAKKRMANLRHILTYFCGHYIEQTKKEYDENNRDNFIAAYLYEMNKVAQQGKETTLDELNLSFDVANLFIAGTETTSTTMLWFMLYMLHFPDVQRKIYDEIKEVIGTERPPTMQDRTKLNYTNAAISESQRLSSIVPLGLPHLCSEDTVIKGYTVPAGTTVMVNFDAVLLDKETWKSPMEFQPERFLDAEGNYFQPEEMMPFSLGRRLCLGEALAKMELFLFLTALVQRFELLPEVPGQLPPRIPVDGITSPPQAFTLRFIDRMHS